MSVIRRKQKPERPRNRGSFIPKRLGVLILTILVLAIPVVIYFTRYISNQTTYFNNQNFRELVGISGQLEQRVTTLSGIFDKKVKEISVKDMLEPEQAATTLQRMLEGTGFT